MIAMAARPPDEKKNKQKTEHSDPRNNTGLLIGYKHPTKTKSAPDDLIEDT